MGSISGLSGDAKSRRCVIRSTSQWHLISMNDSFVPKYKDGKHPTNPTAEIFTLADYLRNASTDEKEKGLHLVNDNSSTLQITTAYDTTSSRRLIVDGCKCSLGIMSKMHDNQTFPTVTILECYGESIPQMFCGDYSNVIQEGLINYYFIPTVPLHSAQ